MKPRFQRTDRSAFPPAGLLATAGLLTLLSGIAHSRDSQPVARPLEEAPLIDTAPSDPSSVAPDTAWFGGSGQGNGTVVLGGIWDWEASSGETPLFFPDGDPVGNAYRDGWVFEDFTSRSVVSLAGPGHWRTDGTYDFDFDRGSFAHRAKTHPNDGANDGPPALDDPSDGLGNSSWSVWIGTNLHLNPEHCSWQRTAGYADSWSQGIAKLYRFRTAPGPDEYAAPPAGAEIDLRFYHRFAVEDGYDTCWVEVSFDGVQWQQVGSAGDPNGIWNGGTRQAPRPDPDGGPETVSLTTWPGGNGDLHVRLRLSSDSSYSDESYGSDFHFAWQVDDLSLRVDGTPIDLADFETEMGGWEPRRFEGGDAVLTGDPVLPSGRIDDLGNLSCFVGPGACGPQGKRAPILRSRRLRPWNNQVVRSFAGIRGPERQRASHPARCRLRPRHRCLQHLLRPLLDSLTRR